MELDAELKENHVDILRRFYQLFEAIYKYGQGITWFARIVFNPLDVLQTSTSLSRIWRVASSFSTLSRMF